jgi:hypothetical protein
VSQDLVSQNDFTFSAGAWAGYYNNAYLETQGMERAGVTLGSRRKSQCDLQGRGQLRPLALVGFSDHDTYNTEAGKLRNHLWADFGISYSL